MFTDPDYPGERLRRLIDEHVPGCKHAFLPKEKALGKHGVGIEHARVQDIRQALSQVYELVEEENQDMDWQPYLVKYGLIGGPNAKDRRQKLGAKLKIGYANGKQLAKRLSMFQINLTTFEEVMRQIIEEETS